MIEENEIINEILDNYVALWRHIVGDKRLVVNSKVPSVKPILPRNCRICGQLFIPSEEKQRYKTICGSKFLKTGCAWKSLYEGLKKEHKRRRLNKQGIHSPNNIYRNFKYI